MLAFRFPKVQVIPEVDRASFRVDGIERLGYEFGLDKSRPFFYPIVGASGAQLTRMGHPNPVGHEHHKSVWFAHQKVGGVDFWGDRANTDVRVRHRRVTLYQDGDDFGGMALELDWWANGRVLMRQSLIVTLEPQDGLAVAIDFQSRFETADGPVELGQTNFGFLGVRVAKTISEQFGGGQLRNEHGAQGEPAIFGKTSRWVDYSGPSGPKSIEGICYMDHPENVHHPSPWHVRRDGWMESAFNLASAYGVARDHPLDLRYRLLIHEGFPSIESLDQAWSRFAAARPLLIQKAPGEPLASLRRAPTRA